MFDPILVFIQFGGLAASATFGSGITKKYGASAETWEAWEKHLLFQFYGD